MRKSHFRWFVASICLLLTTVSASAQREFYVMGSDGNWNTNIASAVLYETAEGSNIYENEVEFLHPWFKFVEQLTEEPDDWENYYKYSYGPMKDSDPLCVNGCADLYNPSGGAFKINKLGKYKVTVDMNTKTAFVGDGNFSRPTTFGPEIYVIGTENAWSLETPQATLAQTEEEGVYSGIVSFKGISEFKILTSKEPTDVSYGTAEGFVTDVVGNDNPLTQNGSNIPVFKGTYEVTVDMKRLRLKMKLLDEQREMYIVGNDNEWDCNKAGAVLKETGYNSNVYVAKNVNFSSNGFILIDLLSSDWNVVNSYRFEYEGDPKVTLKEVKTLKHTTKDGFHIQPGTYDVIVDMNNMTMLVAPTGWVVPNMTYMMYGWNDDRITTLYEDADNKGVFLCEITFDDTTQFRFTTDLNRWGGEYYGMSGTELSLDTPIPICKYGGLFELPAGKYRVTLDFNNSCVYFSAQREFYVIGSDGKWNTNIASAVLYETAEGSNIYENEVEFLDSWFYFAEQLTENANDWDSFEKHTYGPEKDSDPLCVNGCADLYNPMGGAFKIDKRGKYKVTVDMNTKTACIRDEYFSRPPNTFGPEIYVIGTENAWSLETPQATLAQTEEEGVYSGIVSFKGISEFKILTSKEPTDVSYGTAERFVTDVVGNDNPLTQNGSNIPVFKGTYEVTVDMKRLRLKMKLLDEQREMYIVGNDNEWDCNKAGAVLKETGYNSNVYEANNVNFSSNVFFLIDLLSSDWGVVNSYKYGYVDDPNVTLKEVKNLKQDSNGYFQIESGTYDVIVDMNNMTMLVAPVGWVVPNMTYMVDFNNHDDRITTLYEDADNKGVFLGEITFDDNKRFCFTTVLGDREEYYGMSGTELSLDTPIPIRKYGNPFDLPAGKYSVTLDLNNSCVYFNGDTSTSVEGFRVNTEGNEKVFDISGVQYVRANGKRIVIINGKKIVK